ncbi:unnamed protein product [Parascedosporium putredinis]|uniref:Uncharacterized protein n=1 Tax=Parascedosporium putredinis TaxID=1442378 RepID=A0A9P1MBB6_9PEZI|nr:unnamed protein product [Parascedosporium putredinis]CAI7998384.1 unnamed protein product [Parascedosporium putredinis]
MSFTPNRKRQSFFAVVCEPAETLTSSKRARTARWHSIIQTSASIQKALFFLPIQTNPGEPEVRPVKNPILEKHFMYFFSASKLSQCRHTQGFPDLDFYTMFDVRLPHITTEPVSPTIGPLTDIPDDHTDAEVLYSDGGDGEDEDTFGISTKLTEAILAHRAIRSTRQHNADEAAGTGSYEAESGYPVADALPKGRPIINWPEQDDRKLQRYLCEGASWRRMLVRQPPAQRLGYGERTHVNVNYLAHPYFDYYRGAVEVPVVSKRPEPPGAPPLSVTTPSTVSTGGIRMAELYDLVQLNLSRMSIQDPGADIEETFLESTFQVYWSGTPSRRECPDEVLRKQIKRLMGRSRTDTIVVQIAATERPLHYGHPLGYQVANCFGPRFRSREAVGDPHHLHRRGINAITGPSWLKKNPLFDGAPDDPDWAGLGIDEWDQAALDMG